MLSCRRVKRPSLVRSVVLALTGLPVTIAGFLLFGWGAASLVANRAPGGEEPSLLGAAIVALLAFLLSPVLFVVGTTLVSIGWRAVRDLDRRVRS